MIQIPLWKRILIVLVCLGSVAFALPNLYYDRVERHNDAASAIAAGNDTPEALAALDLWPSWAPSYLVNLGLDLRGGAHLLAEVHVSDVYADRIDGLWPEVRDRLREARDTVGAVRRMPSDDPAVLRVAISEPAGLNRALEIVGEIARPMQTLTGIGTSDLEVRRDGETIVVTLSAAERVATDDRTMRQSLEIIRRRVDQAGTREPTIVRQGSDRILIQVPGIGSAAELKALIGTTARLTFHPVVRQTTNPNETPGPREVIYASMDEPGILYVLEQTPVVSGEQLVDSQPDFDQNGRPAVSFRFNPAGGRAFGLYTAENIGSPFAIVLDDQVISAPVIQSHIPGGSGIITGRFTVEETTRLAILLRAGALPAEMTFLEERTIGPELGQDSVDAGVIAGIIGTIGVIIFMVASYGWFGVLANIALAFNVTLIFGTLSLIGATLTLPGIAAVILTIGIAIDANVLIFERIREELRVTTSPVRAIQAGFERAMPAITDANITSIFIAVILFALGSGPVRGFAVVFGIGIVTSVFTAIFVTRLLIIFWLERRRPKTLHV